MKLRLASSRSVSITTKRTGSESMAVSTMLSRFGFNNFFVAYCPNYFIIPTFLLNLDDPCCKSFRSAGVFPHRENRYALSHQGARARWRPRAQRSNLTILSYYWFLRYKIWFNLLNSRYRSFDQCTLNRGLDLCYTWYTSRLSGCHDVRSPVFMCFFVCP